MQNTIIIVIHGRNVINWHKASGFTGLFNTKDHGAITLVKKAYPCLNL